MGRKQSGLCSQVVFNYSVIYAENRIDAIFAAAAIAGEGNGMALFGFAKSGGFANLGRARLGGHFWARFGLRFGGHLRGHGAFWRQLGRWRL